MLPNQNQPTSFDEEIASGRHTINDEPEVFTTIYQDSMNIAIWQRACQPELELCAHEWLERYPSHTPKLLLSTENIEQQLASMLPPVKHIDALKHDILLLIDMVSCLFECKDIGLRLAPLKSTMCPRFHIDNIPCRLVTTYGGPGTEWLKEGNINRGALVKKPQSKTDQTECYVDSQGIQRMASQDVALLKGSGWEGNEQHGLVHRSPQLKPAEKRLLLTFDF